MTTKTDSTAYLLCQTRGWSSETCGAIERVVLLAEKIEDEAASNSERTVSVKTQTDLWNALVALRSSLSSQDTRDA